MPPKKSPAKKSTPKKTGKKPAIPESDAIVAPIKYKGTSFDFDDTSTTFVTIKDATLTDTVLELRYLDHIDEGYCAAKSVDGINYVGTYGYELSQHQTNPNYVAEFRCYRDKAGAVLLNGILTNHEDGSRYRWIVQLWQ